MEIQLIQQGKEGYLPLLLLADEQEDLVARYLYRGELYALFDPDLRAVCLVTDEGNGIFELQNLAVAPAYQRKGYGKSLVRHIIRKYAGKGSKLVVGTGDSPITVPFYLSCGFYVTGTIRNYMVDTYDHPIYENGVQLFDKVTLEMALPE